MSKKIYLLITALICSALVLCALIVAKPSVLFRNASTVSVKGYAVQKVVSDSGSWNARISAMCTTEKEAYQKLKKDLQVARDFFESLGSKMVDLEVSNINVAPIFKQEKGYNTNEISSYLASANVSYTTGDIAFLQKISSAASGLIEKDISIISHSPQYFFGQLESLKLKMISSATKNAYERASLLTEIGNTKLGGIASASQGIFQITRPLSTETSDYGSYDTSSVEKEIKCVVSISFKLKD